MSIKFWLNLATFLILVGIIGSMNYIMSFVVECKCDPKRRLSGLSSEALNAFETVYDGLVLITRLEDAMRVGNVSTPMIDL